MCHGDQHIHLLSASDICGNNCIAAAALLLLVFLPQQQQLFDTITADNNNSQSADDSSQMLAVLPVDVASAGSGLLGPLHALIAAAAEAATVVTAVTGGQNSFTCQANSCLARLDCPRQRTAAIVGVVVVSTALFIGFRSFAFTSAAGNCFQFMCNCRFFRLPSYVQDADTDSDLDLDFAFNDFRFHLPSLDCRGWQSALSHLLSTVLRSLPHLCVLCFALFLSLFVFLVDRMHCRFVHIVSS